MEALSQMQARHRREQRDLQSRITQKKKATTKKTRKGVNLECDELELHLQEKQRQERALLDGDEVTDIDDVPGLDSEPADENTPTPVSSSTTPEVVPDTLENDLAVSEVATSEYGKPRKRNRQKERLARRAAEQEAAAAEAGEEAASLPNWKRQERTSMLKAFKENGLIEKDIAPDGHCLFSAVADQLAEAGIPLSCGGETTQEQDGRYRILRKMAARYIEGHPDEFAGFLGEPLGVYVHKIRDTAEWGGHVELIALAKNFNVEICVIQDGRIDKFEPEAGNGKDVKKIWLAYYRHGYGLGEHYNSLRRAP